ncbi:unnamed protein product [Bemisia tabaci]|uniref:Uncharacterized protein n=1 Tax=Bemisia tabaci TaxID=7038 RepID=A0A9P0F668_BEMTA|nr:unnamed protein product [Bemisia tabaci]
MNNDGGGDALRKAANLGSVDLDLSEVDDVSAIYDYFNSVLKEKPKSLDIGSVSFDETTPDSSTATALHGKGSVSDCFYHIHKHGSQLGVRLLLPALNRDFSGHTLLPTCFSSLHALFNHNLAPSNAREVFKIVTH